MGNGNVGLDAGLPADTAPEIHPRREEVLAQLASILHDQHFTHSRHYTALLRYVVERALEGRTAHLKERVLGAEVFGRDPGYDTNQDPVVRTSACEIRKRLAHYYQDPARAGEVRIDLSAGSYVPEFRFPPAEVAPLAAETVAVAEPSPKSSPPDSRPLRIARRWFTRSRYGWAVVAAIAIGLSAVWAFRVSPNRALDRFWGPVWEPSHSVLLCVGEIPPEQSASGKHAPIVLAAEQVSADPVPFADAVSMARVVGLLRERGKTYQIRETRNSTLADLRKGSVVLIGGLANPWIVRLQDRQRFTLERDAISGVTWVRDRDNPGEVRWRTDPSKLSSELREDYAVVSRFVDPLTESEVVILAGLGNDGAAAAGEFVTDPAHLRALESRAPSGWEHKNLQAVLATAVIAGEASSPRILATDFR